MKKQKPRWQLRTRATSRQTAAAAAIDRTVIDKIEWTEIDRVVIDRAVKRTKLVLGLGRLGEAAARRWGESRSSDVEAA